MQNPERQTLRQNLLNHARELLANKRLNAGSLSPLVSKLLSEDADQASRRTSSAADISARTPADAAVNPASTQEVEPADSALPVEPADSALPVEPADSALPVEQQISITS